ncbi:tRNA dimethylallyltransferase [Strigomonas culicis]|uniref:tRNA dimethylallyltransferase n=1 Tax=Strigomonas culicis TaxID=28005 RepID=S9V148_9TRYP|nr:tRNA dimethylallyltransferase [Strigomonas culicis]|eukprot:EPY34744.1 tRNA dimethylallyltransferase [Strigomonas culicis]
MLVGSENIDVCDDVEDKDLWHHVNLVDPEIASRYHPNDTRRLRRLLDIYRSSGKRPTELYEETKRFRFDPRTCFFIWAFRSLDALYPLLDKRVDEMVSQGLVEEVKQFFHQHQNDVRKTSIFEAIGVKEFLDAWQSDETSRQRDAAVVKAIESIKAHTRHYASKQVRWLTNRLPPLLVGASYKESIFDFGSRYVKMDLDTDVSGSVERRLDGLLTFFLHKNQSELLKDTVEFPLMEARKNTTPVTQEHCSLCDFVVYGRDQMSLHLNSKRHRGALKRQHLEKSHLEQFGVPVPPRKKHKNDENKSC